MSPARALHAHRWARAVAVALTLALASPALAGCGATNRALREVQGARAKVREVRFEGVTRFSHDELTAYLHVGDTSWVPFTPTYRHDAALEAVDAQGIETVYRSYGFHHARVRGVDVVPVDDAGKKVDLVVRVEEGPPTRVATLKYQWSGEVALDAAARRAVEAVAPLAVGGPFEVARFNAALGDLRTELMRRGFPLATTSGDVEVHEGASRADVAIRIVAGAFARVRTIRFDGLVKVPRKPLDNEVEVALGEPYSPALTHRIEDVLKALRVLRWVAVVPPTEVHGGHVDLVVRLSEADPQTIAIGPELGFEAVRWQEQIAARYTHTNVFGELTRLDLTAVGGYAELPNPWRPDQHGPVTKLEPAFSRKGILERFLVWSLTPSFTTDVQEGYQYWSLGDRLGASRWFGGIVNASLSHNVRYVDYFRTSAGLDTNATILGRDFRDPFLLSYVEAQAALHLTDSIGRPTNGAMFQATYDVAGGAFAGDYDYQKLVLEARGYWRPFRRWQVVARAQGGSIWPYGAKPGVPLDFKFYLGGANTVRGFGSRHLSPKLHPCAPTDACGEIPIGGLSMVQGTFELRYNVVGPLALVGFTDMGDVEPETFTYDTASWNYTAGPGLRVDTPVGLARLDLGFRLNRLDAYPGEGKYALYFGLGEAF